MLGLIIFCVTRSRFLPWSRLKWISWALQAENSLTGTSTPLKVTTPFQIARAATIGSLSRDFFDALGAEDFFSDNGDAEAAQRPVAPVTPIFVQIAVRLQAAFAGFRAR